MNTLEAGSCSEAMILARMLQAGYAVLTPCNVSRYDLAFDDNGALRRVQVKTGRVTDGTLTYSNYSIVNRQRRYYTSEEVDYFAVYSPELDKSYLVPFEQAKGRLRLDAPRNGQTSGITWARDFEIATPS